MNTFQIIIVIGIALAVIEILLGAATAFELLILGVIFVMGGLAGMAINSVPVAIGTIVVLSLAYIFFGRKIVRNKFNIETTATNIDAILGKTAKVIKEITPSKAGQVKIDGEIWRATAETNLEEGSQVKIESVSGVTLQVKKK